MKGWSKKEKGLMDKGNSVEISGRGGGYKRGLNGNGKNTMKKKLLASFLCGKVQNSEQITQFWRFCKIVPSRNKERKMD